ncbi:MAG: hypothetical protein BWY95_00785 [Bacteroidetes bacterium ADurb.BinA104]|nr:MAG: hypothetical protein BWY95_00785 [Bacteroidetes bacterium ADurb.BinA104]
MSNVPNIRWKANNSGSFGKRDRMASPGGYG